MIEKKDGLHIIDYAILCLNNVIKLVEEKQIQDVIPVAQWSIAQFNLQKNEWSKIEEKE